MTKPELLSEVAKKSGQTIKDVQNVLKHYQQVLVEELKRSESVDLLQLGRLKIFKRAARTGVNPRTKEKIKIAERSVPKLTPSGKFKDYISGVKNTNIEEFNY